MKILSKLAKDCNFAYWNADDIPPDIITCTMQNGEKTLLEITNDHNNGLKYSISLRDRKPEERLKSACILNIPFPNNYGHCLHDVIPSLLFYDKNSDYQKIFTTGAPLLHKLLTTFKIKFSKIQFIEHKETISQQFESMTIINCNAYHKRDINKTHLIKESIDNFIKENIKTSINNRLIYCTRNHSKDVRHGRLMDASNEMHIVNLLKHYCKHNGLIFTMFNGQENGETMSHIKQLKIFNEAQIIVGPHGSAMANVIYCNSNNNIKVCEFTSGTEVQVHGGIFNKHYNALFGYLFDKMYDYYLIPFDKSSNPSVTSIDLDNLKEFLTNIK